MNQMGSELSQRLRWRPNLCDLTVASPIENNDEQTTFLFYSKTQRRMDNALFRLIEL